MHFGTMLQQQLTNILKRLKVSGIPFSVALDAVTRSPLPHQVPSAILKRFYDSKKRIPRYEPSSLPHGDERPREWFTSPPPLFEKMHFHF